MLWFFRRKKIEKEIREAEEISRECHRQLKEVKDMFMALRASDIERECVRLVKTVGLTLVWEILSPSGEIIVERLEEVAREKGATIMKEGNKVKAYFPSTPDSQFFVESEKQYWS